MSFKDKEEQEQLTLKVTDGVGPVAHSQTDAGSASGDKTNNAVHVVATTDDNSDADGADTSQQVIPEAVSYLPDRYEYLSLLGEGGMGAVFKVKDRILNTIFALKMLRPQLMLDADALRRFNLEARAARELDHPNIASVYEFGTGKLGAPYLVMEYLQGKSLDVILAEEQRIAVPRAVDLSIQIADALEYAHSQGIVHRDIKPSNIVINKAEDGTEIVKLVDFGIAKTVLNDDRNNFTKTGDVIGSPCYMSPEQCEGPRVGPQADIYSLGCVMYEMLSSRPPFVGENSVQTVLQHMRNAPMPLSSLFDERGIPQVLNDIVLHCLKKAQEKRYPSAAALRADLDAFKDNQRAKPSFEKKNRALGSDLLKRPQYGASPIELFVALVAGIFLGSVILGWAQNNDRSQLAYKANYEAERAKAAVSQLWYLSKNYKYRGSQIEHDQLLKVLAHYGPDVNAQKARTTLDKIK